MGADHERTIDEALARLDLEDKVRLLTGRDSWSLHGIDAIGLRPIVMSDGPAGVRGDVWDERSPSVNFPSPTAIAASWDVDMVRQVGRGLGDEARRKAVDVVLAPTINIQRSPYGGRHFEAFSEDPLLTASIATAYVKGVQDHGVAATVKHYVANDAETERFTASSDVDERTLREVYLAAFETPVTEGPAWVVMSAYNSINGVTASEHPLLQTPLKDEWSFDGVVVSDWTAVRSLASAAAAQDLAMPGPDSPWGDALVEAVRDGRIAESVIDDKVRRILRLAIRVGALADAGEPDRVPPTGPEATARTARAAAEAGMVLLENDGLLPLAAPRAVAVIGEGARDARTQGGGSATVIPTRVSSPLEGIGERWPDATVTWSRGAVVQSGLADIPLDRLRTPDGRPGMRVRYLDADGGVMDEEVRKASRIVSFDAASKALRAAVVELSFTYEHGDTGDATPFGVAGLSDYRVEVDGREVAGGALRTRPGDDPATAVLNPPFEAFAIPAERAELDITVTLRPAEGGIPDSIALGVGLPPVQADASALIAEAAAAAAAADVAVVVVSTSNEVESEGFDRTSLALPGTQDALVEAVVRANPRTVVVVNSGSPVLLPWRASTAAVLAAWFPGQEFGTALAAVLSGDVEPGGRLPVTWPSDEASVPVSTVAPTDGHLTYDEGVHVGHRAWLRAGATPAYPFGHGLGYTTWDVAGIEMAGEVAGDDAVARVRIVNQGPRAGKAVVQLYLEPPSGADDMPQRWHAGFATACVADGEAVTLEIPLPRRRFQRWEAGWRDVPGTFTLHAGLSATDLRAQAAVTVGAAVAELR